MTKALVSSILALLGIAGAAVHAQPAKTEKSVMQTLKANGSVTTAPGVGETWTTSEK